LQGKINVAFKMNIQINLTTFEVEHVMNFFLKREHCIPCDQTQH
jgi:hypothetical protein